MRGRWGELAPKCGNACRTDTARGRANRLRWGCDRKADPPWSTSCWRCSEHGRAEDCPWCKGDGRIAVDRCPSFFVGFGVGVLIDAIRHDSEHGSLPVPGGILAQSHVYTLARAVVRGEWSACEARASAEA